MRCGKRSRSWKSGSGGANSLERFNDHPTIQLASPTNSIGLVANLYVSSECAYLTVYLPVGQLYIYRTALALKPPSLRRTKCAAATWGQNGWVIGPIWRPSRAKFNISRPEANTRECKIPTQFNLERIQIVQCHLLQALMLQAQRVKATAKHLLRGIGHIKETI